MVIQFLLSSLFISRPFYLGATSLRPRPRLAEGLKIIESLIWQSLAVSGSLGRLTSDNARAAAGERGGGGSRVRAAHLAVWAA